MCSIDEKIHAVEIKYKTKKFFDTKTRNKLDLSTGVRSVFTQI